MSFKRQDLGKKGEEIAINFLIKKHYQILARNFRFSSLGEIDIIACDKDKQLVFVEVKTKKSEDFGLPEEELTFNKKKKLIKMAEIYLSHYRPQEENWRIDLIAIDIDPLNKVKIFIIKAV